MGVPRAVGRWIGRTAVVGAGAMALRTAAWVADGGHLRLGATREEVDATLPGDDLVPDATATATRGVGIDAPADYVWPWVAQLGQDRAGFYSIALLENAVGCRITNADSIVEEWQHPQVGDPFPLHPDVVLRVALVEAPRALVVRTPRDGRAPSAALDFDFSWAFVVRPEPDGHGVRLVVRERYRATTPAGRRAVAVGGAISTLMTTAMLEGIRVRAERLFSSGA